MRSERLEPVADILPCISAMLICSIYTRFNSTWTEPALGDLIESIS
jgi:hypothetical protein